MYICQVTTKDKLSNTQIKSNLTLAPKYMSSCLLG